MSKRHSVTADLFQTGDQSVFQSGNFSAKHLKNGLNITNTNLPKSQVQQEQVPRKVAEERLGSDSSNDIESSDGTVQPVTISGGFQNIPISVFDDSHQLGVSLNRVGSSHRGSLLSSSIASSRMHRPPFTQKSNTNINTNMSMNGDENSDANTSLNGTSSISRPTTAYKDQPGRQRPESVEEEEDGGALIETSTSREDTTVEPAGTNYNTMKLPGGFINRDIESWVSDNRPDQKNRGAANFGTPIRRVASSGSLHSRRSTAVNDLTAPGAFRRDFLATRNGDPSAQTNTFLDFLEVYGNADFAGEDLRYESDDNEEEDEEHAHHHRKSKKASTTKAFLLLLKAFLGTGIIFLPKAFSNGGLLFSNVMIVSFSFISYFCFIILIRTTSACKVSGYGDVGAKLFGTKFQFIILLSLVLSQLGFAATYVVFVGTNCLQILNAILEDHAYTLGIFILGQMAIFTPISLTRSISKLGFCALIADVFIFLGIVYIYIGSGVKLLSDGISHKVEMIQPSTWTLFIGTAVFSYEGIGLLIPIQESMEKPEKFDTLLFAVMMIVTLVFSSIASISYLAFGDDVHTIVLGDFPRSTLTLTIQTLYSLAILLSTPVQLFPAIKIIESYIFSRHRGPWRAKIRRNSEAISILSNANSIPNSELAPLASRNSEFSTYDSLPTPNLNLVNDEGLVSGKSDTTIKLLKNLLRVSIVALTAGIAYLGSSDLDKFVSLIGALTCVPLIYVYPPLLYRRAFEGELKWSEQLSTSIVAIAGVAIMLYTGFDTISHW